MIKGLTVKYDQCKETYTDDQEILGRNSECFRHEKPFFPKMKAQGLEELLDIFQIPEQNISRASRISDETC